MELLSAIAEREGIPLPPTEPVVGLPEGAETPEKALEDFTRAAAEGDVDAALTLIAPEVRPLIALEVSIDHVVMTQKVQSQFVEELTESKQGFRVIGFSPLFAKRETLKHRKFDVLKKRPIEASSVVLRIKRVTGRFSGVGENHMTEEVLAVRREDRWYLFYLLGYMNSAFEGAPLADRHVASNTLKSAEVPGLFSLQSTVQRCLSEVTM